MLMSIQQVHSMKLSNTPLYYKEGGVQNPLFIRAHETIMAHAFETFMIIMNRSHIEYMFTLLFYLR